MEVVELVLDDDAVLADVEPTAPPDVVVPALDEVEAGGGDAGVVVEPELPVEVPVFDVPDPVEVPDVVVVTSNASTHTQEPPGEAFFVPVTSMARV